MNLRILHIGIDQEKDVVAARQRARQIAAMLGFGAQEQTRIATTVSELARNALIYAREGRVEFSLEGESPPQILKIIISDKGDGIEDIKNVLSEQYKSTTGMGLGILSAYRLMDRCDIDTGKNGTTITLSKLLPRGTEFITVQRLDSFKMEFASMTGELVLAELKQQNQELITLLAEQKTRNDELRLLTKELEDTNRGVVALYAELDEKAHHLRRADEMKSRFLSNMSHEFRTPLSSIRALARILLDRIDGELSDEQEKQVSFIMRGAEDLTELVNDLLDIAKIEAGKISVRNEKVDVEALFGALRGMLRPLLVSESVELHFSVTGEIPSLISDESKISQILRNFISNALKFTEQGIVEVNATLEPDNATIRFAVRDTGTGIAEEHQQLIFEEFSQVENSLQHKVKGTGLGLPLCQKLAHLLGGKIELVSKLGVGSTFSVLLPLQHAHEMSIEPDILQIEDGDDLMPILVIEDHDITCMLYEKFLEGSPFRMLPAHGLREADDILNKIRPKAIILDILLDGYDSWHWLATFKNDKKHSTIPVIVITDVDDRHKGLMLGADAYFLKPLSQHDLLTCLHNATTDDSAREFVT